MQPAGFPPGRGGPEKVLPPAAAGSACSTACGSGWRATAQQLPSRLPRVPRCASCCWAHNISVQRFLVAIVVLRLGRVDFFVGASLGWGRRRSLLEPFPWRGVPSRSRLKEGPPNSGFSRRPPATQLSALMGSHLRVNPGAHGGGGDAASPIHPTSVKRISGWVWLGQGRCWERTPQQGCGFRLTQ